MTNKTILIIDDEEPIRELLKLTLQSAGFDSVLEASNGEDGLALATRYMPDLILLDLMLPGMDGLSVCRRLKTSPDTHTIPIIMLTAKSDESDIVVGLEMGANDYITKPFSRKVLTARIRAQFRIAEQQNLSSVLQQPCAWRDRPRPRDREAYRPAPQRESRVAFCPGEGLLFQDRDSPVLSINSFF